MQAIVVVVVCIRIQLWFLQLNGEDLRNLHPPPDVVFSGSILAAPINGPHIQAIDSDIGSGPFHVCFRGGHLEVERHV